jgi:hypothetical protein
MFEGSYLISKQLNDWYRSINQVSGGRLNIFKHAVKTFSVTNAGQAALAYYAIFSLLTWPGRRLIAAIFSKIVWSA